MPKTWYTQTTESTNRRHTEAIVIFRFSRFRWTDVEYTASKTFIACGHVCHCSTHIIHMLVSIFTAIRCVRMLTSELWMLTRFRIFFSFIFALPANGAFFRSDPSPFLLHLSQYNAHDNYMALSLLLEAAVEMYMCFEWIHFPTQWICVLFFVLFSAKLL